MKKQSLFRSFKCAIEGLWVCMKNERNMKIHVLCSILAVTLGVLLEFNPIEYMILSVTICMVFALELMNSAIEKTVDLVTRGEIDPLAKLAKDFASGGVLIAAMTSIVIAYFLYIRKLIDLLM